MKAHEQRWRDVGGPCGGRVVNDAGEIVADEVTEAELPLILAAPPMARTLIEVHEAISTRTLDEDGALEVIARVLRAARVRHD